MADERGSWGGGLSGLQKVALALGIPASAAIVYILYCRYREDQEEQVPFVGEEEIEFVLKVPQEAVKVLLGRQGAKVNQLRKDTHARINVDLEESGAERLVRISGSPVQVCRAKAAVHQILEESMPMAEKVSVPTRAIGRIIGKGGETVRAISRTTGAKIDCSRQGEGALSLTRVVTLSGTRKEVQAAKELIREKLSEDEAFRSKLSQSAATRMQRKQPLGTRREVVTAAAAAAAGDQGQQPYPHDDPPTWTPNPGYLRREAGDGPPECRSGEPRSGAESPVNPSPALGSVFEVPSPDVGLHPKEHLEVYVSASENPSHFWIQIIGVKALHLDKLAQEMTKYYEGSDSGELESVQVGDIVAAYYPEDRSWYRAEVLGTLDNGNLDIYFVDFGDNGEAPLEKLRLLRGDFLSLPFQAIECSLAGVAPTGPRWEEAALDEFDRLTHCAQWKTVFCKICTYVPEGSGVRPYVRLFKPAEGQFVDVGEELIRLGYAVPKLLEGDEGAPRDLPEILEPPAGMSLETLSDVGNRGETVFVHKSFGRNHLLFHNRAVYASPENKKLFEEENQLRQEGKLPRLQTHSGMKTVRFLKNCTLEIGVNECDRWELTKEIVCRHFLRNLGVVVPPQALALPEEPIAALGSYWCDVTVNGLDTVRVPISVQRLAEPKPISHRLRLAQKERDAEREGRRSP